MTPSATSHVRPMRTALRAVPLTFLLLAGLAQAAPAAKAAPKPSAHDYPTVERVLYVQECLRNHPGPPYEMTTKCSCALDHLAAEVKFDDYIEMSTIVNAVTIGGERGGDLRDNETLKPKIARWRELQKKVRQACFLAESPK